MSVDIPTSPVCSREPLEALAALRLNSAGKGSFGSSAAQAAKDFESVLLYKVMEEMKRSIPESGLLDSGATQQVQDMFWFYLAQDVCQKGGIGLWRQIAAQFQPPGPGDRGNELPAVEHRP